MRTGKCGYYKRVTATDTSTSLTITVHDSDDAVGASADLHSKMFTKTSKAIPTSSDPLDALDLPFFQMGNTTSQLTLANRPPSSNLQLALTDLPGYPSQSALENVIPLQDQAAQSDSDNEKTMEDKPGTMNPFQMMHHVIPSHAKSMAEAKAMAKASAKASSVRPVPKAKTSSSSKKRKQPDNADEPVHVPKILKLPDTVDPDGKVAVSSGADDKIVSDFTDDIQKLRKTVLSCLRDTDSAVNDALKTSQKDLSNLLKKIRSKSKSLKRRNDNGVSILGSLEDMIAELSKVHMICGQLLTTAADGAIHTSLKEISDQDWHVSSAMFKRSFRCASLASLRVGTWADFTGLQDQISFILGGTNGIAFFELMVSDMIQRLLKALPVKVSCLGFVRRVFFFYASQKNI